MEVHENKVEIKFKIDRRKAIVVGGLAFLLTLMQVNGWQRSMKYGTSMHTSSLFQKIGMLESWQCVLAGIVEWVIYCILLYCLFSFLDRPRTVKPKFSAKTPRHWGLISFGLLLIIYIIYLIGCYPGFYNYDGGNQLVQVMYEEVPYNTHHPLLHTLIVGGIITIGYHIRSVDLTFGVFLYCLFQVFVCVASFSYAIRFIYQYTRNRVWTVLAFVFYALCPPIIMFSLSTTKDTLCSAVLLVAVLKLYEIYRMDMESQPIMRKDWIITTILLALSCLLRNNIVYAIVVLAVLSIVFHKQNIKGHLRLFVSVTVLYVIINNGLIKALDATPGSITEALSVPFQQIARLYMEEGESAFNDKEQELLYAAIEPSMLSTYDPVISDAIKYSFWRHLDVMKENTWEYISLWARKGLQYPKIYLDSFLDNTYQAWYPATMVKDRKGYRYFNITDWQEENGRPRLPWLYDFYKSIYLEGSYQKYPVFRLFFSVGAMMWMTIITWFYGLWKKDRNISRSLSLILLVCLTLLFGPVSDVRYYLILFCLFPVCLAFLIGNPKNNHILISLQESTSHLEEGLLNTQAATTDAASCPLRS